jgi:hypothetical protein
MPSLRTGPLEPSEHPVTLTAAVRAHVTLGDVQLLELGVSRLDHAVALPGATVVALNGDDASLAFVQGLQGDWTMLFARRPSARAKSPLAGVLHIEARTGGVTERGVRVRFAAAPPKGAPDPGLRARFAKALAAHLVTERYRRVPAWHRFAADRLEHLGKPPAPPPARDAELRRSGDLELLMGTMTGMSSIQEALQTDRTLFVRALGEPRTVAMGALAPPPLAAHPFEAMLRALGRPAPAEPLATAIPADGYYVRFRSITDFFDLVDQLDAWATPAARLLEGRTEEHALARRYEAELGLSRGPLARALGPSVVDGLALTGSDPYLREGSDLTVVFRVKSDTLFEAGLAAALAEHAGVHGALAADKREIAGVEVTVRRSANGAVRQHRARVGDLAVVSNSPGGIERVLATARGQRPRLSDEPDFRYMLARDGAEVADVLAFAGDRFVAAVVGPAQKVLQARRQLAAAELLAPGWAALVHGWLFGRAPRDADELVRAGLLDRGELTHRDGGAIDWAPGRAARSSWGTPAALTPLVDLPRPAKVSISERDAYRRFAESYQRNWSTYVDPAMARLRLVREGGGLRRIEGSLRVLPLIDASEYQRMARNVGSARVEIPTLGGGGFRLALGVGSDATLREHLGGSLGELLGKRLAFDWLGDWAMIGAVDDARLATALARLGLAPERPADGEPGRRDGGDALDAVGGLPVYAAVEVRSHAAASLALLALRKLAEEAVPGGIDWAEARRHRDTPIVRVRVREGERRDHELTLHYCLSRGVLFASLSEATLVRLVDEQLDGRSPRTAAKGDPRTPQLVVDLASAPGAAIATVLAWLLEERARDDAERGRLGAEAVLRGAPEAARAPDDFRRLALATLGVVPVTPDGLHHALAPDGVRDPHRGTPHAPAWPAVPVPGSPAARLLASVASFRSGVAFDEEGRDAQGRLMTSLRIDLAIGLR